VAAQQAQLGQPQMPALPAVHQPLQQAAALQPYQFANIDMSGLQGLDWSTAAPLYGMYTA